MNSLNGARSRRATHASAAAWLAFASAACGSSAAVDGGSAGTMSDAAANPVSNDVSTSSDDAPSASEAAAGDASSPGSSAGSVADSTGSVQSDAAATPSADSDSGPTGGCALETVQVPASGAAVALTTSLANNATYLLKAAGSVQAGSQRVDAEFVSAAGAMGSDVVGTVDVGIDVGLFWPNRPKRFTQTPPGPGRMKWNPQPQVDGTTYNVTASALFRADGTYYMVVVGSGRPLSLKLALPPMASATGTIAVSLYALSPAPPATFAPMHSLVPTPPPPPKICGDALDSIDVTVVAPIASLGKMTTDASKLYLLQASGTSPAGGAGLGDGDAEYMDFGATDNGGNDGEGCTDFGLGVDEVRLANCNRANMMIPHRKNWWGTVGVDGNTTTKARSPSYRNDHIYYMLYLGTGKPISFVYLDGGYADNMPPGDVLVRIFPLP